MARTRKAGEESLGLKTRISSKRRSSAPKGYEEENLLEVIAREQEMGLSGKECLSEKGEGGVAAAAAAVFLTLAAKRSISERDFFGGKKASETMIQSRGVRRRK